jgi:arsenite-transporting ATPase
VLDCPVHDTIQLVKGTQHLFIININPEKAAEAYRNRVNQPLEEFASPSAIEKIREVLSGACTTEIDSFDEFSRFVSGETDGTQNDVIIIETAPTGHKLRLLELPAAWSSFTDENPDGASCLGPTSALKLGKEGFHTVVSRSHDASLTQYNIVTRADKASLKEASRASTELKAPGMENQQLYINGEFHALDTSDELATKIEAMGNEQLRTISDNLKALPLKKSPLLPYNILRVESFARRLTARCKYLSQPNKVHRRQLSPSI